MAKGKKFGAAEKHFLKKEEAYQKRIKELAAETAQLRTERDSLTAEVQSLTSANEQQKEWIERLLAYTELSKEDIKAVCKSDKERGAVIASFVKLMGLTSQCRI